MKPITTVKALSKKISIDSLFSSGGTLSQGEVEMFLKHNSWPYCKSHYLKDAINADNIILKSLTFPLWYVSRGKYIQFRCLKELKNSEMYQRIMEIYEENNNETTI